MMPVITLECVPVILRPIYIHPDELISGSETRLLRKWICFGYLHWKQQNKEKFN